MTPTTLGTAVPLRINLPSPWESFLGNRRPGNLSQQTTEDGFTTASQQAQNDPPQPAGSDGWSPASIKAVRSTGGGPVLGSMIAFARGENTEPPGQRLSLEMIEELAPRFSRIFRVNEQWVRDQLAHVYIYIGENPDGHSVTTIGHHIYVPNESKLDFILSRPGRRLLAHELAHTMQFLVYEGGSIQGFLGRYVRGHATGRAPNAPGSGGGGPTWGALFTGANVVLSGLEKADASDITASDRLRLGLAPAATVGVPVALAAGGALALARHSSRDLIGTTRPNRWLGHHSSAATALGTMALPLLAGSAIGAVDERALPNSLKAPLGAIAGGLIGAATLKAGGAFLPSAGRVGKAIAGASLLGSTMIGFLGATLTRNTIDAWKNTTSIYLSESRQSRDHLLEEANLTEAIHDTHWMEVEAERIGAGIWRDDLGGREADTAGGGDEFPVPPPSSAWKNRLDQIVWNPLIIGLPAAGVAGVAVLGTRTVTAGVKGAFKNKDGGLVSGVGSSIKSLASEGRGPLNSFAVGAATTLLPMVASGVAAPLAYNSGMDEQSSRLVGTAAAASMATIAMTALTRKSGHSALVRAGSIGLGAAIAAGIGFAWSGVAIESAQPAEWRYRTG